MWQNKKKFKKLAVFQRRAVTQKVDKDTFWSKAALVKVTYRASYVQISNNRLLKRLKR